jgi:hypothetical protein
MGGVFYSCYQENPNPAHFGAKIEINASIEKANSINATQTRASDASWTTGDAIGIYMKKSTNLLGSTALADNVKYVTSDGSSSFTPSDPSKAITLPYTGSKVDFIAYYPQKTSITSYAYPVNLSDQSKQTDIDLLYSDNVKEVTTSNPSVNLNFKHQLSKIVLNISSDKAGYSLAGLKIKILNVAVEAPFSLIDGTIGAITTTGNILMKVSSDGTTAEAILMPCTSLSDKSFLFILGEDSFILPLSNLSNITSFEKSKKYMINIVLSPQVGPSASINKSNITNWTDGPTESVAVNQNNMPYPGSANNPYTISQAIINSGDKDVWVKGYIVGYYSGTTYTSFVNNATNVTKTTNIAIAESVDETNPAMTFPVGLTSGTSIKEVLNLQDHPENLGKEILINGDIETYYSTIGMKTVKNATIN